MGGGSELGDCREGGGLLKTPTSSLGQLLSDGGGEDGFHFFPASQFPETSDQSLTFPPEEGWNQ